MKTAIVLVLLDTVPFLVGFAYLDLRCLQISGHYIHTSFGQSYLFLSLPGSDVMHCLLVSTLTVIFVVQLQHTWTNAFPYTSKPNKF